MDSSFKYFKTRDGISIRYGFMTGVTPKKGSIILLSGRAEFIEKHFETISDLKRRGFDVFIMDWRGQGLSSRLLINPHKGYVKSFDFYLDDLRLFVKNIVMPTAVRPVYILSFSMGGHICLRYLHDHPEGIEKAILVSPMIKMNTSPYPELIGKMIAYIVTALGGEKAYAPGKKGYGAWDEIFEGNRLTSDKTRFFDVKQEVEKNPDLALGGVTVGWVKAAFDSIDRLLSCGYPEKISTPILLVRSEKDQVVCTHAQKTICSRIENCRLFSIPDSFHEILKEKEHIRAGFWRVFDEFIDKKN
ncbi:alpha/beta hydrolase [Desulfobacterales bacterium HSG16]|nr:alpha/beta hydrolase [Desulfobacterales bacterium HSG16]